MYLCMFHCLGVRGGGRRRAAGPVGHGPGTDPGGGRDLLAEPAGTRPLQKPLAG